VCAHDGSTLIKIGAEISEQLDIIPQQVRVIQHQRIKYACPCCDDSIRVHRHRQKLSRKACSPRRHWLGSLPVPLAKTVEDFEALLPWQLKPSDMSE
jgi:transposase